MNKVYLFARILHVVTGAFWFGTVAFTATFLMPSMAEAGPDAGKVMVAMRRRHFFEIVPAIASVTVLTGLWLYWRFTGGFSSEVMSSRGLCPRLKASGMHRVAAVRASRRRRPNLATSGHLWLARDGSEMSRIPDGRWGQHGPQDRPIHGHHDCRQRLFARA